MKISDRGGGHSVVVQGSSVKLRTSRIMGMAKSSTTPWSQSRWSLEDAATSSKQMSVVAVLSISYETCWQVRACKIAGRWSAR